MSFLNFEGILNSKIVSNGSLGKDIYRENKEKNKISLNLLNQM